MQWMRVERCMDADNVHAEDDLHASKVHHTRRNLPDGDAMKPARRDTSGRTII